MANITYNPDNIINKRFGGPGGTAVTSTPEELAAKQGILVRGSTLSERSVALPGSSAPPNASAAPVKTDKVFTGLCEALNAHQQYLVQSGKYEVADVYSICLLYTSDAADE